MSHEGLSEALGETDEAIAEAERAMVNLPVRTDSTAACTSEVLEALVKAVRSLRDAVANVAR